jgi:hypothetical protein
MAITLPLPSLAQSSLPNSSIIDPPHKVLNSLILTRSIFKFIDSLEATTLSLVSHTWKQLIFDKKSQMFFVKNQISFLHGRLDDFSKADYYLLGERHKNKIGRAMLRELILGLAQNYFVAVLLEGIPSLLHGIPELNECLIENVKHFTSIDVLDSSFNGMKFVFAGWDTIDNQTILDKVTALQKTIDEKVLTLISDYKKLEQEEPTAAAERGAQIQKEKERIRLICEILFIQHGDVQESIFQTTFPKRTQSMIDTLNLVESSYIQQSRQGKSMKVIILCGAEHLRSVRPHLPEYDLSTLYQTLGKLKAVAMLPSFIPSGRVLTNK